MLEVNVGRCMYVLSLNSYETISSLTKWKAKEILQALEHSDGIKADDWRLACLEWLERRKDKWMETL